MVVSTYFLSSDGSEEPHVIMVFSLAPVSVVLPASKIVYRIYQTPQLVHRVDTLSPYILSGEWVDEPKVSMEEEKMFLCQQASEKSTESGNPSLFPRILRISAGCFPCIEERIEKGGT